MTSSIFKKLSLTLIALVTLQNLWAQKKHVYQDKNASVEKRVADLLSKMSLEEKVAQMRIFHANQGIEADASGNLSMPEAVKARLTFGIAGIKNPGEFLEPEKAAELNNQLQKYIISHNRWGIPALFVTESYNGVDAEGCTKFGRPMSMAASFNTSMVHDIWDVVGREARIRGMHMCHSPEADLARDPRFGRMSETFGEDTYLTSEMVVSAVTGVQGNYTGLKNTHIGAVTKHFAGYGQVQGGTNFSSIEMSPRGLIDEIYPPFKAAVIRAKTLGIMASHGDLNGIASHANYDLLTGVLKNQWGFKGYVVSDANDIARLNFFMKVAETPEAAAEMALKAGMDVDLYSDAAYALLPSLAKKQPELLTYINQSAARVLRTKFILGLFDQPYVAVETVHAKVRTPEALELARKSDLESFILLKNSNNTLPFNKTQYKKIALLGPVITTGAKADFEKIVGQQIAFSEEKGFELTNKQKDVPKLNTDTEAGMAKLLEMAKNSDAVILYLGGDEYTSKEGFFNNALGDRMTIDPVGPQDELLTKIKALGKPVVVILKHRRTLSINTIAQQADAIIDTWDMTEFGNEALAKIIFGMHNPSGKSPVTIPRNIGQLPFHYSRKEINNKKGYLFTENGPLYPFGFGLSYASFEYKNLSLSTNTIKPNTKITATIQISNTSQTDGQEVVQLYIKDKIGSVIRPDKELKAFQKVLIKAGETKTLSFTIDPEMLKFTDIKMHTGLEAGDFEVMIGSSSAEGQKATFTLLK